MYEQLVSYHEHYITNLRDSFNDDVIGAQREHVSLFPKLNAKFIHNVKIKTDFMVSIIDSNDTGPFMSHECTDQLL